jgi:hypothetical protein
MTEHSQQTTTEPPDFVSARQPAQQLQPRPAAPVPATVPVRKQGAWGLWWLTVITLTVYYFFWYHRVNKELAGWLNVRQGAKCAWWSQLIPFLNLVGLSRTAKRVNAAHAQVGSPTVLAQ